MCASRPHAASLTCTDLQCLYTTADGNTRSNCFYTADGNLAPNSPSTGNVNDADCAVRRQSQCHFAVDACRPNRSAMTASTAGSRRTRTRAAVRDSVDDASLIAYAATTSTCAADAPALSDQAQLGSNAQQPLRPNHWCEARHDATLTCRAVDNGLNGPTFQGALNCYYGSDSSTTCSYGMCVYKGRLHI